MGKTAEEAQNAERRTGLITDPTEAPIVVPAQASLKPVGFKPGTTWNLPVTPEAPPYDLSSKTEPAQRTLSVPLGRIRRRYEENLRRDGLTGHPGTSQNPRIG